MTKVDSKKTIPDLIAPCGMNCSLCRAYRREHKACPGCRGDDSTKTKTRVQCGIKNCEQLTDRGIDYCISCSVFPCKSLLRLDSRYKAKYGMSMIENLATISKIGIQEFVKKENERWTCHQCGKIVCVHKPECCFCGHVWKQESRSNAVSNQENTPDQYAAR